MGKDKSQDKSKDGSGKKDSTQELSEEQLKIEGLTDDLKRVQADFENYKKRCDKENKSFRQYATANLIKKLLTILDSFEIAMKNTENHDDFVKGMELILAQFHSLLKDEGIEKIETKNQMFDPYLHEVLLTGEGEDGKILEELQKGYKLKDSVLRHSKVKIGKR